MVWPDVIFTDSFFIMTLYLMVGVLVYGYLESWTAIDAFYFQIVAASTVGFGDFVPSSTVGRLLTCIYTPVGTVLLYRAMHPYASLITSSIDSAARSLPGLADVPESLTAEGDANHVRHVVRALLSPLLVIGVGAAVFYRFFGYDESVVEAIYFAFTCVSTIGFGDLAPGQTKTKMAVIVYVALGSAICGVLLEHAYLIEKRRQIRTTDHTKYTAELLLQASCWDAAREGEKAIHGARADGGGLSEADFLLAVLTAHELIDVPTLVALRRQFAHIMNQTATVTAGGAAKPDAASAGGGSDDGSSGKGAAVQRLQEAGLPSIILTAAHGGYAEWYVQFWMKRVELVRSKAPRRRAHLQPRVCVGLLNVQSTHYQSTHVRIIYSCTNSSSHGVHTSGSGGGTSGLRNSIPSGSVRSGDAFGTKGGSHTASALSSL